MMYYLVPCELWEKRYKAMRYIQDELDGMEYDPDSDDWFFEQIGRLDGETDLWSMIHECKKMELN